MGEAVGQFLPLAVVVAFSPIPIIGVVVVMTGAEGRRNGPAFLAGWVAGLSLVSAVVLLASTGVEDAEAGPGDWVDYLKLVLGLAALLYAAKQWRGRPVEGGTASMPGWMAAADELTSLRSAALGLALSAANPKNLLLVVASVAPIAQLVPATGERLLTLAIFVSIATIGIAVPLLLQLVLGDRARPGLEALRGWLASNGAVIMTALFLVIGAKLFGDAIAGFAA